MSAQHLAQMETQIIPGDVLNITVMTSSIESNNLYNNVPGATLQGQTTYRVDQDGMIGFPGLRSTRLGGLSLSQARDSLTVRIGQLTKNPTVSIAFANFRVTVIGEVTRPGSFLVPNNQINLLEAIGLAGDMTPYGRRENILIIRQIEGVRSISRIDLTSVNALNSPFYQLKQNDIVYIEPDKSKEASISQNVRYIPIISASISVVAVLISVLLRR